MKKLLAGMALIVSASLPVAANASLQELTNLYVFGDSLSDGGNSGLLSSAATAGVPGGPYVIPPYPYYNGQYSNGPVAVEYLWQAYNPGSTSFAPSLAGGTNYAIGGATSGVENYNSVNPGVPVPLQPIFADYGNNWQLQTFAAQHPVFDPETSLFVVWLFPNDLFYAGETGNLPGTVPGSPGGDNVISNGIANILTTVNYLASLGAQHFLVPNLPDLGKTPEYLGDPAATAVSELFNLNLAQQLTALDIALTSAEIVQFDTFGVLNRILANPGAYGFEVTDKACVDNLASGLCNPGNWDKWVFWDSAHPTTSAHALLGREFAASVPEPGTIFLLAIAFLAMAVARRRVVP
jgi:phospholipase/lecithinase/hemolysin